MLSYYNTYLLSPFNKLKTRNPPMKIWKGGGAARMTILNFSLAEFELLKFVKISALVANFYSLNYSKEKREPLSQTPSGVNSVHELGRESETLALKPLGECLKCRQYFAILHTNPKSILCPRIDRCVRLSDNGCDPDL